jgi:hypothetical protein
MTANLTLMAAEHIVKHTCLTMFMGAGKENLLPMGTKCTKCGLYAMGDEE